MIKAVTFDLWDTIIHDDSDEKRRAEMGLRSKRDERRHLVWEAIQDTRPLDAATVSQAYDVVDSAFNKVWKEHFITWSIEERLSVLLRGLGAELPAARFQDLVEAHEIMEVEIAPDPIEGIKEALEALSTRYKLCIVSDTIVTPGTGLRDLLEKHDLKKFFSGFAFSDEVGHSKPHPSMFESAAAQMGTEYPEMAHIGDRDHNDVKGSQKMGMKAVLFTATRGNDKGMTSADAICESHFDLPVVIDRLSAA
jgi:putative hydrolase of the HAD superfamily